jgi:hypothetical protein
VSPRKPATKNLLLAGIAAPALMASLWVLAAFQGKPLSTVKLAEVESSSIEQASESAPRGLSRQRKDFEKALNILGTAASSDERLTGYFSRVQKRVEGKSTSPENGSGVRAVRRVKKDTRPVELETLSAADAVVAAPRALSENVLANLQRFFADAPPANTSQPALAAAPAPDAILPVEADREPATSLPRTSSQRLTVGDMEFETNAAIERWIDYYTVSQRGRQTMQIGINRSGSYIDLARAEFHQMGLPEDLVWLAHVESVWHTTAISPAAAGGIWQFIPSTATDYGLMVSREYDERLDPGKQTEAAAAYLRDLYTIFGDWALAMAAYNCGEPRVMDAIVKNGRANFWELHEKNLLPKETLNYVPKILAAIAVASRAEMYGFSPDPHLEETFAGR